MNIAGVMLAAGNSRRFKGIKQLAMVRGKPMIGHVTGQFAVHGKLMPELHSLTVILGSDAEKIRPLLPDHVHSKVCMNWQDGMGASLALAASQVEPDVSHLLVVLADQVDIGQPQITKLIQNSYLAPDKIIVASFEHITGPPVIFPRRFFASLARLKGDQGAKKLLKTHCQQVLRVDLPQAQNDIDTWADLQHWQGRVNNSHKISKAQKWRGQ
ncbi:MAG: molybdenum cofactor cytidylyltransferase [Paraglaciecola sp.]